MRAPRSSAPPQAPETGASRLVLGRVHVTGSFWYRIHLFGVRTMPEWAHVVCIALFTGFFFCVLLRIRAAIASNLEVVLGPCGWPQKQRRIWKTLHEFGWCLTERYERLGTAKEFTDSPEGREHWERLVAAPGGFILATAHVGHWESGSLLPAGRQDRPVHLVREEEGDPEAQELIRGLVERHQGSRFRTHFAREDPSLGVTLLDALRRGDVVALQADRPRAGGRSLQARLFGRPYALPRGPFALARAAGVPILPAIVLRTGRRASRPIFGEPFLVHGAGEKALEDGARRFARPLAEAIREAPHQWFCFRHLWPAGSAAGILPGADASGGEDRSRLTHDEAVQCERS